MLFSRVKINLGKEIFHISIPMKLHITTFPLFFHQKFINFYESGYNLCSMKWANHLVLYGQAFLLIQEEVDHLYSRQRLYFLFRICRPSCYPVHLFVNQQTTASVH